MEGSQLKIRWRGPACLTTNTGIEQRPMAPAALMCLLWRENLLYFVLRLLISSVSPLRRSEIKLSVGYRRRSPSTSHPITFQFSASSTFIPTCFQNLATGLPCFSSSYYQPDLCLICPCNLKMLRHYFMDLAPFNMGTVSFETSKTTYLSSHYQIP
jgi:hypothetical protein